MKELYLRSFGTGPNGNSVYEWTENKCRAALYHEVQAKTDCELLNRYSPDTISPECGAERLVFENFRSLKMDDDQFGIVFEARTEVERLVSQARQSNPV